MEKQKMKNKALLFALASVSFATAARAFGHHTTWDRVAGILCLLAGIVEVVMALSTKRENKEQGE
jgi:uncharacterized membrane protein HdeD (DUF308 family)